MFAMSDRSAFGGGEKNCFFRQLILLSKMVAVKSLYLSRGNCGSFLDK